MHWMKLLELVDASCKVAVLSQKAVWELNLIKWLCRLVKNIKTEWFATGVRKTEFSIFRPWFDVGQVGTLELPIWLGKPVEDHNVCFFLMPFIFEYLFLLVYGCWGHHILKTHNKAEMSWAWFELVWEGLGFHTDVYSDIMYLNVQSFQNWKTLLSALKYYCNR